MSRSLEDLFDFIDMSRSPFHSVLSACRRLDAAGFLHLEECSRWDLKLGKCYYTTRNQSSLIAFRMPEKPIKSWRMSASHSDSPSYRVKMDAEPDKNNSGVVRLRVEGYGGMIAASWMDRPLTLAGRVLIDTGSGINSELLYLDRDLMIIPSLAIHMDRSVNEQRELNPRRDMQPVFGCDGCHDLKELLAEELGVSPDKILNADLTLCPRQAPVLLGAEREFICSPRLDDLECAWGTLSGFLSAEPCEDAAAVWCMFDNEEVGSGTRQGAKGSFLPDVMRRIEAVYGISADEHCAALAGSLLLSADNAHAVHPNYQDKADASAPVKINGGVVLKYNSSQKYTTTALTGALFTKICNKAGVPVQVFTNRADIPGGSTLGNLLSAQVSVPMADIGLPQLAMHACVETAGAKDPEYLAKACAAFYGSEITCTADGAYTLR
ncbi:MAG: M18 family aminopeptidase [Candidatus Limivicinus sp.]